MTDIALRDYSLIGEDGRIAVESGLADAIWYISPVPKDKMRELLRRKDGPGIRDTIIWFGILAISGFFGYVLWGHWWAIVPFAIYGVIYGSSSDSRWHESSHGTAFKTDWMNNVLYEVSSFMVFRESIPWRWSHTRHHTDTYIVGRDPEIAVPRPANVSGMFLNFIGLNSVPAEIRKMIIHAAGELTQAEKTYIPESEHKKVYLRAKIYILVYAVVIGSAIYNNTWLPLMYIGLPGFYGCWLMRIYGHTQHTGLADDVLDHRLNSRTVCMNFINRYLYWNMNYHIEHHMYPMVPYHALPKLHELMKDDCPKPYGSILDAWKEIISAVLKQRKDPGYFAKRELSTPTVDHQPHLAAKAIVSKHAPDKDGWIQVCDAEFLQKEDVLRFDHEYQTFAIYRSTDNSLYATDGLCTHGNTHLADGLVTGTLIECPKHNGRFDIRDGSPQRAPVCVGLKTYDVEVRSGVLYLDLGSAHGVGAEFHQTYEFCVVSNDNVATYIKELVLEANTINPDFEFKPGDYIQLDIPAFEMKLDSVDVKYPYAQVWQDNHIYNYEAANDAPTRRNYSIASNPDVDTHIRFNVRIATPPMGQLCKAGTGSSYVFNLKPGDKVTAIGPFGDFHIKDTAKEMIYLGGGAGMAPLRSHLSYLLETRNTERKISFWYGARSEQEMFYREYFQGLVSRFENFSFFYAYSEPLPEDTPAPYTGFIHEILCSQYLTHHDNPSNPEYYLCGPPIMIQAAMKMLKALNVPEAQISYDEF